MNLALKFKIIERFGSQAEFSAAVGMDESKISRVIRQRSKLTVGQKKDWAEVLGCKTEDIFEDK
jgi:hypothetical protein